MTFSYLFRLRTNDISRQDQDSQFSLLPATSVARGEKSWPTPPPSLSTHMGPDIRHLPVPLPVSAPMCAFSFMNSKRCKPMLNKRREVSGRACYLCVAAYLLPIRCACALPRSTRRLPLFMELLDRRGATLCSASACL